IHTALHGYLKAICEEANIQHAADADITALFGLIREKHPKLQPYPPGVEGTKILRGLARVVDALNPVRNLHSMAHPNEELLPEPEALLAVNAVKSLLHYLNFKLR
ncbi:MAG: abortive infection family protein, partial [Terriglobales bacterium]